MKTPRSNRALSLLAGTLLAGTLLVGIAAPSSAESVGISITLGQPNFYGRIDLGDMQRPPVVYRHVRIIESRSRYAHGEPLYLRVPTNHQRNWRRYCRRYDACGHPVYFVRDNWYREQYVPQYETRRQRGRGNGSSHDQSNDNHYSNDDGHWNDDRNENHDNGGRDHDRRDSD